LVTMDSANMDPFSSMPSWYWCGTKTTSLGPRMALRQRFWREQHCISVFRGNGIVLPFFEGTALRHCFWREQQGTAMH
jgi:hypothetical protein